MYWPEKSESIAGTEATRVCIVTAYCFENCLILKELSHEIEMGRWWYGWIEHYLEMTL